MKLVKTVAFSFILFLILITFVSSQGCADEGWKGYSKIYQNKTIALTCTTCNYINFTATNPSQEIFLDNVAMTKSGSTFSYQFLGTNLTEIGTYQVDGYSNLDVPLALCFDVTPSGKQSSLGSYIMLLLIAASLFLLLIWISHKFNRERRNMLYKKIVNGYFDSKHNDDKNLGIVILYTVAYGLLKNLLVFYYLVIVFFLFILVELIEAFAISSMLTLMTTILNIFIWGFIPVFIVLVFNFYELIKTLLKDISDSFWGVGNV